MSCPTAPSMKAQRERQRQQQVLRSAQDDTLGRIARFRRDNRFFCSGRSVPVGTRSRQRRDPQSGNAQRAHEKLKAHEQTTTDQIAVLTVPTIGGASIEEYATRVFDTWKLGQKGKDNGVLLVIAPKDRKLRIEVGYGLEGTLTDVVSSRIIRNVITPAFKSGDFDKGVSEGVDPIIGTLEGSPDVAKLADVGSSRESTRQGFPMNISDPSLPPWPLRILLGCFIFGIIGLFTFMGIDAGHGLVSLLLPDPVLGDVPDHHSRRPRRAGAARDLRDRISDREAHRVALRLVCEGAAGHENEGNRDDRRHGDEQRIGIWRLVIRWRRWFFGRRRKLGRRRLFRQLVEC